MEGHGMAATTRRPPMDDRDQRTAPGSAALRYAFAGAGAAIEFSRLATFDFRRAAAFL